MDLYVIRHTKSYGNDLNILDSISKKYDKGLSKKGSIQARELIPKLKKHKFDLFIISSLNRTKDTIMPYLKTLENPKVIVSDLTLERNGGIFTGMKNTAIKEYCNKNEIKDLVSFRPENGESILEVYERAKKFIEYLKTNFKSESILLCGHKNFISCLEIVLKKKVIKDYYKYPAPENGEIRKYKL